MNQSESIQSNPRWPMPCCNEKQVVDCYVRKKLNLYNVKAYCAHEEMILNWTIFM